MAASGPSHAQWLERGTLDHMMLTATDFTWNKHFWTTNVCLPSWRGFQSRGGPYATLDSTAPTDGFVQLVFAPEGRDHAPLRDEEVDLVNRALALQEEMQRSVLGALLSGYPALQKKYERFLGREFARRMPNVTVLADFQRLIGLHALHVHNVFRREPYVGMEFGCTWDVEHGLGAMMCGARVVEVGGADTAFLLWIAERDAKKHAK
jgi:hypothetical protein